MSMLAGPRRKQKVINLRAKNNAWSSDNNKFGQRMLEKMGWSEGKGLGMKENGIVEHVVAKYKNDDKGLGFEDRNDQWTKHEDDFNSLLANLSNGDNNENKLHSGISLEDKSKKSKARVHYHKFTRGKDLTRYSEKDLANIFGKKSLKNDEKNEKQVKDDLKTIEQVFTDKGSMEDYFKSKIAAIKSKSKRKISNTDQNGDESDYVFRGFSQNNEDSQELEIQEGFSSKTVVYDNSLDHITSQKESSFVDNVMKKAKKKSKKKQITQESDIKEKCEEKPFSFYDTTKIELCGESNSILDCDSNKKRKKKKKKKYQELEIIDTNDIENNINSKNSNSIEIHIDSEEITNKKKKSKCKERIQIEDSQNFVTADNEKLHISDIVDSNAKKVKKSKKKKYECLQKEDHEDTKNILVNQDDLQISKKKKNKLV